ncbi:MAG TPA: M4 family metallopeptidase [Vicinamibacterales bacterium]|nr:M4 family metallopeptidase [Vicinamibacterales bacterium]
MTPRSIAQRLAAVALLSLTAATAFAQGHPTTLAATRASATDLRVVDQVVDGMIRDRALVIRETQRDTLLPDRVHERFDQYLRGVRIVGGDLTRQTAPDGTVSLFGTLHDDLTLDLTPALSVDAARVAIATAVGGEPSGGAPELVVLPLSDGYHLAYGGQAFAGVELLNVFVDARTGALLQQYSDFINEVGHGKGAYGDDKKVSAKSLSGTFVADDPLRPAAVTTYDMKGNLTRTLNALNRVTTLATADIASDSDNDWTDSTVVDAHVYGGWYYDFIAKRFARHGLDDHDLRMAMITHPVRIQDIGTATDAVIGQYYLNAFFCPTCLADGRGAMVFGEGAPRGTIYQNIDVKPFSAALDVVAHELTHGVTANSARLNGFVYSEAGALNEAFSDMFGVATSFFYQAPGNGALQASYVIGKDLSVPSGSFPIRSLSNPLVNGDPDHYSLRFIGGDPHYNSTIASHAYYLAIEGGTDRTSGRSVQGVGAANREQIEKTFFRALTALMPSSSTFALTRVATIQAARDLYGVGGVVERAITQAWDAVGVQERTVPTAALLPDPASPSTLTCTGLANPHWVLGVTASAGTSNLRITQWAFDFFDHTGALQDHEALSSIAFAQSFSQCGPGSTTMLAQTDACTAFCVDLRGDTTGSTQITFNAVDDAGRLLVFSTPRTVLLAK